MAPSLDDTHGTARILHLPDTLATWPWPKAISPHYEYCKRESSAWAEGFHAFGPKAQAAFNKCDFSRFWLNAIQTATPSAQKRFIDAFEHYTDSVVQQSLDRSKGSLRDFQSYFEIRRETIGAKPSFAINQIHLDLPDGVVESPIITRLVTLCIDMLIIGNDICSYNVEQSRGDSHNLVTVVMAELDFGVQEAIDWIGRLHDELANDFRAEYARVPSLFTESEAVNLEIRLYADALGNWVRANDQWSFEVWFHASLQRSYSS
ncbi:putative terpene synthase metal binding domain protein [Diaporthe ampelina]|uniref:Terpene synthase n=1 Tax=Diaporthe ampelina TaxID=1214573 RepID=A0A0G2FCR6_9PEZI|nr:putative terpene synthase metal binding domain protein [Diaporthe ampelina]